MKNAAKSTWRWETNTLALSAFDKLFSIDSNSFRETASAFRRAHLPQYSFRFSQIVVVNSGWRLGAALTNRTESML